MRLNHIWIRNTKHWANSWCVECMVGCVAGKDVQSKWNEVKTLVPQRDQTLQDELKKQQNNEALRRQFAEKSNQVPTPGLL